MAAVNSQGTTLSIDTTDIGGLVSYSGFDGESSEIDTTTLSSTAKEYVIGLQDFGNFGLELLSDQNDAGQTALQAAKTARTSNTYVLLLSDNTTATFDAYVKSFTQSGGVDDVDKSSCSLRITGVVAWVPGTP